MAVFGAIDCGTNSTRLLIATDSGDGLVTKLRVTRLGEGVDKTGALSAAAIARTLAVLAEYKQYLDEHNATSVRAVATSAARDASNSDDFLLPAAAILGTEVELLSGSDEGSITYEGAQAGLSRLATTRPNHSLAKLVLDIGGGSTELIWGRGTEVDSVVSLDAGCVRLTERFLHDDPYDQAQLDEARRCIDEMLVDIRPADAATSSTELVGVSGSVTSLAAVDLGLTHYVAGAVDGHVLRREFIAATQARLSALSQSERQADPLLPKGREDVLVAGSLILLAVMDRWAFTTCTVSESDILAGLIASQSVAG